MAAKGLLPPPLLLSVVAVLLALAPPATARGGAVTTRFDERSLIVYVPSRLPPAGARALVVVLHGGLGNARHIEDAGSANGLNMDALAEQDGFLVAYLDGTPVTRFLGDRMLGWNAGGGCCGQSAANDVDDVAYIGRAVRHLESQYGVDPARVFGLGHSNGAMMTLRMMCETGIYAAAVAISGPLNLPVGTCPAALGERILAIHGQDDENVPLAGGRGAKGLSQVSFVSEARSRQVFDRSGATYELQVIAGADHKLGDINAAIERSEGRSVQQKVAQFFGLRRR